MSKELMSELKTFIDNNKNDLLYNALLNEVAYYYDYIKSDYTDFDNTNLSLDDLKDITDRIMSTYYMNEGLNEVISDYLYDYIDNKGGK